jgi:hypothetical protein
MKPLEERVKEFMTGLGFKWYDLGGCWAKLDDPNDRTSRETQINRKAATFMYRQSLEARINEAKDIRKNIEGLGTEVYFALQRIDGHIEELDRLLGES